MLKVNFLALLCFFTFIGNTQTSKIVEAIIADSSKTFLVIKPFKFSLIDSIGNQTLIVSKSVVNRINLKKPERISVIIPKNSRETVVLKLIKIDLFAAGFNVITSGDTVHNYTPGVYYQGIVEGTTDIATLSFFKKEVMGNFHYGGTATTIHPISRGVILQQNIEKDTFGVPSTAACGTENLEVVRKPIELISSINVNNTVKVYLECDYALQQNKGGVTNTVNWITAVYNNVAALYQNESIKTQISQVFVWVTPDTYSRTSSVDALYQIKAARPTFNGDLAHLVALGGQGLGGVAWVDALCTSYKYAYSNIQSTYQNIPTFSWTVEVMTHEMGHNLGSPHTQSCTWIGGALDNCYTTEGGCPPGPAPTNGGTIMSYCHLTGYGINFANGFGQQPGDKIRSKVYAASCLGTGTICNSPTGVVASDITQTSATISWAAVTGASTYRLEYKMNTAPAWLVVVTTSNTHNIPSLIAGTLYNVRVKTTCDADASPYSTAINFNTLSTPTCNIPTGLLISNINNSGGKASWNNMPGATKYIFEFKANTSTIWQGVNTELQYFVMPGTYPAMTPNTLYNTRVKSVCSIEHTDYSPIVNFTTENVSTPSVYCSSKGSSVQYEYIYKLQLGTINNTFAKTSGYTDATTSMTDLVRGTSNIMKYQPKTTGSGARLYWKAWIDYNNDYDFTDPGEEIFAMTSTNTLLLSSNFIVPSAGYKGKTRLRIAMRFGGYPTPCGPYTYGQTVDLSVNLK